MIYLSSQSSGWIILRSIFRHLSAHLKLDEASWRRLSPAFIGYILVALAVFVFLVGELRISAAELIIRGVAIDLLLVQVLHIGFTRLIHETRPPG